MNNKLLPIILFISGIYLLASCNLIELEPEEEFNVIYLTADGKKLNLELLSAGLGNNFIEIECEDPVGNGYELTILMEGDDYKVVNNTSFTLISITKGDSYFKANINNAGGTIQITDFKIEDLIVSGTFEATLINREDTTEVMQITDGAFRNIKLNGYSDEHCQLNYAENGIVQFGNVVLSLQYDSILNTFGIVARSYQNDQLQIIRIPAVLGTYNMNYGDVSYDVYSPSDNNYEEIYGPSTIEVIAIDTFNQTLEMTFDLHLKSGWDSTVIHLTEGYLKFSTE